MGTFKSIKPPINRIIYANSPTGAGDCQIAEKCLSQAQPGMHDIISKLCRASGLINPWQSGSYSFMLLTISSSECMQRQGVEVTGSLHAAADELGLIKETLGKMFTALRKCVCVCVCVCVCACVCVCVCVCVCEREREREDGPSY